MSEYLFTSESVSEGHPDKVADQVSDAILDAVLAQDPKARVAAETLVNTGLCVLAGEITTTAHVDYIKVARETIAKIGYNASELGFDANGCAVGVYYDQQSPDIAQGVNEGEGLDLNQGAGDQGLMFGYACADRGLRQRNRQSKTHRHRGALHPAQSRNRPRRTEQSRD